MTPTIDAVCKSCRRGIVWVTMGSGKRMPIDPLPTPAGNVHLLGVFEIDGTERAEVVGGADLAAAEPPLYVSHFVTCDNPQRFRKPR